MEITKEKVDNVLIYKKNGNVICTEELGSIEGLNDHIIYKSTYFDDFGKEIKLSGKMSQKDLILRNEIIDLVNTIKFN